jgi:hypothetical protein
MSQERTDNLFASESWTAVYTAFSNISLKAYDFDTIRTALLDYTAQTYPEKFNDFVASSEFIAILDLVAYMGHSLSFRLDMNTRENFMDTAERRASILQMAKSLGYNKTRPINAKGFMKISSVSTNEDVLDNEGVSLAGKTINWNDSNNADWYENFISILNSSFAGNTKIQNPASTLSVDEIDYSLYEINEASSAKNINYSFNTPIAGTTRNFEAVRVVLDQTSDTIYEDEPNLSKNFTLVNRNDGLGSSSDRTGFFVYAVAGQLGYEDKNYTSVISNRRQKISEVNISNSDVWVTKVDSNKSYLSSVSKVDNQSRETAIFNALRTGSGDIVSVSSTDNNSIELTYPDGVFGNAASGGYRTWFRTVDNDNFSVEADDINNVAITVPYTGSDNRIYRLTFTLTSTRDFTENYSGETYASVRRIAPRSYYSQDRMVNAQDYNVYPLTLGTNVVRKLKSVNTSFAGNSRYFEMDDVLGHHSNLSVAGTDGSLFVEDEVVKVPLSYNKEQGKSDNFIRNELTKAIKHPGLLNQFYYKNHSAVGINVAVAKSFTASSSDSMVINSTIGNTVFEGDTFQLSVGETTTYATVVTVGKNLSDNSANYTINKSIPADGTIIKIIRGVRTKFTDDEVAAIKAKVDSVSETTFTLKYALVAGKPQQWEWQVHTGSAPSEIHVVFNYTSGIRDNESEYIAEFTGKNVAFESRDQVKFFYGNITNVVDNETNLSQRDTIFLNYLSDTTTNEYDNSEVASSVTVGQAPITGLVNWPDSTTGPGAEFKAVYQYTGARETYNFVNTNPAVGDNQSWSHTLVSPDGVEYPLAAANIHSPTSDSGKIIGDATDQLTGDGIDTLTLRIDDLTTVTSLDSEIGLDQAVTASTDTNLSNTNITINYSGDEEHSNADSSFATVSTADLNTFGFKGKPSTTYFSNAGSKFSFIDEGDGIEQSGTGIVTSYDAGTTEYTFTLPFQHADTDPGTPGNQNQLNINTLDQDIKFKQYAYGEFSLVSSTTLTTSNVLLRTVTGSFIDAEHTTITNTSGNTYKIIFWTHDVSVGDLIDVFVGAPANLSDIADFSVRVSSSFDLAIIAKETGATYKTLSSHVYDDYYTPAGYKDNTKVKLFSGSTGGNPYEVFTITSGKKLVTESYRVGTVDYDRASKYAFAAPQVGVTTPPVPDNSVPLTAGLWYNTTESPPKWYKRIAGIWSDSLNFSGSGETIVHDGTAYAVKEGISFAEDDFTSFRWDHYADINKRINPSTSNIVDMYVLSSDYVRNVEKWIANDFTTSTPVPPNNYELKKLMNTIEPKAAIADHVAYIPVEFKYLFGSYAMSENQAVFKVIKKLGVGYTDSEIKTAVSTKVNEYFKIDNWDFGDTFYFSELAAYLHKELGDYISSVVITPKYSSNEFTNLLSISCALNEVFMAVTTSNDVKIITQLSQSELQGE